MHEENFAHTCPSQQVPAVLLETTSELLIRKLPFPMTEQPSSRRTAADTASYQFTDQSITTGNQAGILAILCSIEFFLLFIFSFLLLLLSPVIV